MLLSLNSPFRRSNLVHVGKKVSNLGKIELYLSISWVPDVERKNMQDEFEEL